MDITSRDKNDLIMMLANMNAFHDVRHRVNVINYSGLSNYIPHINFDGEPFIFSSELIHLLIDYGPVEYNNHPIGLLINSLFEMKEFNKGDLQRVQSITNKYSFMLPPKLHDAQISGRVETNIDSYAEKIIGQNTLKPISYFEKGLALASSICLLDVGIWFGSGFLISDSFVATNHHVIQDKNQLASTNARFNYRITHEGRELKIDSYSPKANGYFATDKNVDLTVFEVEGKPGLKWGSIGMDDKYEVKADDRVNIIQHPKGLPLQVSFRNNIVEYVDENIIQYLTSTMGGSSGSPVFNDKWELVGVHHAGGHIRQPGSDVSYFRNEGISIRQLAHLLP